MSLENRPLRMLQVANQPGPFYCFLRPLIFELMRQGVDVDVACNQTDSRYQRLVDSGMHMLPLTVGSWNRMRTWLTLRRQLRELMSRRQYDICVVHTPAMSWIVRSEAARAGIPVVAYTAHGLPFFERQGRLKYRTMLHIEKRAARHTDLLLVVNSDDAAAAARHRLVKRKGGIVRWIPGPGIDADRWSGDGDAEALAALREEFHIGSQTKCVLYMGRLMDTKGVIDLVEAVARLKADGYDLVLVVAGTGELEDVMRERAAERGLAERMHLLGWRDDGVSLMHLADVLVLPSTYREGLPTVLLEAGATGKPVVAYNNRGSRDIIVDGETGYLIQAGDVHALAEAMGRVISDPELARRMGEAGRRRVRSTFAFDQGVRAQLDAYAAALEIKGIDAAILKQPLGEPLFAWPGSEQAGAGGGE